MNTETPETFALLVGIIVAIVFIFHLAADVGISRAEAAKACYEAAKVNRNITCQPRDTQK